MGHASVHKKMAKGWVKREDCGKTSPRPPRFCIAINADGRRRSIISYPLMPLSMVNRRLFVSWPLFADITHLMPALFPLSRVIPTSFHRPDDEPMPRPSWNGFPLDRRSVPRPPLPPGQTLHGFSRHVSIADGHTEVAECLMANLVCLGMSRCLRVSRMGVGWERSYRHCPCCFGGGDSAAIVRHGP